MKISNVLLALMVATPVVSSAVAVRIDCADASTFCMSEFQELGGKSASIEQIVEGLPLHVKRNVTFKRGANIDKPTVGYLGPHGHKVSKDASESASPAKPRAFVWDELTGFTASWNSGAAEHTANDRVDLYDFDYTTSKHRLAAWFPANGNTLTGPDFKDAKGNACTKCHGASQRPIFPMYPDWPQFYGEFNDEMSSYPRGAQALRSDLREMANIYQPLELAQFDIFRSGEGRTNARYTPLFAAQPSRPPNSFYPFRPATTTAPFSNTTRAFFHRPNLRLGVLYNRLTALATFEKLKASPIFQKFPDVVFYSLLDCNWAYQPRGGEVPRESILTKLLGEAAKYERMSSVDLRGARFTEEEIPVAERDQYIAETVGGKRVLFRTRPISDQRYRQIPYEDLLKLIDLDLRDMDIRFRHDSGLSVARGYNVYDPKAFYHTDSAMDIGYIKNSYALNPICDNDGTACNFSYRGTYMENMRYFNSYFDGSATMNELLVAQILLYLTDRNQDFSQQPDLDSVRSLLRARISDPRVYFETLRNKYSRFTERLKLDDVFFTKMDNIGPWIQLPFPPDMLNIQNRESFWGRGTNGRTEAIRLRHAQWVDAAARTADNRVRNNGVNICWNVHASMMERYK